MNTTSDEKRTNSLVRNIQHRSKKNDIKSPKFLIVQVRIFCFSFLLVTVTIASNKANNLLILAIISLQLSSLTRIVSSILILTITRMSSAKVAEKNEWKFSFEIHKNGFEAFRISGAFFTTLSSYNTSLYLVTA